MPWAGRKKLPQADALLYHAYSIYKAQLCTCGCGQWSRECRDPDTDGWWRIEQDRCLAGAELQRWREGDGKQAEPGTLVHMRLDPEYQKRVRPKGRG